VPEPVEKARLSSDALFIIIYKPFNPSEGGINYKQYPAKESKMVENVIGTTFRLG
jgi:hypothetical protein